MIPQCLQPPEYRTPVAALTIDGLGLCCFGKNYSPKKWQVAFLRDSGHELEIKIRQVNRQGRVIKYFDRVVVPRNKHLIRFYVAGGSDAHYDDFGHGYYKTQTTFSRDGDNSYDFRWALDFVSTEVPHGNFVKLIKKSDHPGRVDVTIVSIPNALFYTKSVTDDSVVVAADPNGPSQGTVLGRTNAEVGAVIYSATPGEIQLKYDDGTPVLTHPLPYVPDHLYEISLTNMDSAKLGTYKERILPDNYVTGDFHYYYEVIEMSGPKHKLFAPRRPVYHRAIDGDCHIGRVSLADGLMDLITPES